MATPLIPNPIKTPPHNQTPKPNNLSLTHLKQIHGHLFRRRRHDNTILITKLISSAASSGFLPFAAALFRSLPSHDLILLNSMLKTYTINSPELTLSFYVTHLLLPGFSPDKFTYLYLLKTSSALSDAFLGRQIHASLAKNGTTNADVFVLNSLVNMYFKCSDADSATKAFRAIQEPNTTSWNIIMSGLSSLGDFGLARDLFDGMTDVGDSVSWNIMISAYSRGGRMDEARELFDRMPERNLVSWNALIAGYSRNGRNEEALEVFSLLLASGIEPDDASLLSALSACSGAQSLCGSTVARVIGLAKSTRSASVSTALFCLYAKTGMIEEARQLFDKIRDKDLVTWNAMIAGYSQNQRPNDAIELFRMMQKLGDRVKPDAMTMVSVLDSCSQLGALGLGEWVHAYIQKSRIEMDVFLLTALVDMYAKCGDLDRSRRLFSEIPDKDLASWNAMIKGLAIHGKGNEALQLFTSMDRAGMVFNDLTFLNLLNACSHDGLVEEGLDLFKSMWSGYGINPRIEHYGCIVDLLGRVGRLDEAYEFVTNMPIEPDSIIWGALLGACRLHRNVDLAEKAARQLVKLDPKHAGNYILLSNVYASLGKWEDVEKVRSRMKAKRLKKEVGWSAVEMDGRVHEFTAKDRTHPRSAEIYEFWNGMVKRLEAVGYEPDIGSSLANLATVEKEEALHQHSEKLALSFALIELPARSTIRIVKNLRICNDCHKVMEMVSAIEQREIVVRDRSRFHCFSNGSCSCGGYW